MRKYLDALAIFAGTAIGVGIFGLPYATAKLGFFPILIYFIILGGVILILQLAYGEVCLRTNGQHRMPGYAEIYLGKKAKSIILLSNAVGLYGAILAYLIIGGSFLAQLLSPVFGGPNIAYVLIFFAAGSLIIFLGSNVIAKSEIFSLSIFFIVLFFLLYKGVPHINPENFLTVDIKNLFFPYGIILFSIAGVTIIPETREILGNKAKSLKSVIIVGSLIPIITSLVFIYLILGVTGVNTTEDALTGLLNVLGEKTLLAGFLFGIITTFTSYLTIGLTLKKIFWYDLKFSHSKSWVLATFAPMLLYFLGVQSFIKIIAFSAALTALVEGSMVYMMYLKARKKGQRIPEYELHFKKWMLYPLVLLFTIGIIATIWTL